MVLLSLMAFRIYDSTQAPDSSGLPIHAGLAETPLQAIRGHFSLKSVSAYWRFPAQSVSPTAISSAMVYGFLWGRGAAWVAGAPFPILPPHGDVAKHIEADQN